MGINTTMHLRCNADRWSELQETLESVGCVRDRGAFSRLFNAIEFRYQVRPDSPNSHLVRVVLDRPEHGFFIAHWWSTVRASWTYRNTEHFDHTDHYGAWVIGDWYRFLSQFVDGPNDVIFLTDSYDNPEVESWSLEYYKTGIQSECLDALTWYQENRTEEELPPRIERKWK